MKNGLKARLRKKFHHLLLLPLFQVVFFLRPIAITNKRFAGSEPSTGYMMKAGGRGVQCRIEDLPSRIFISVPETQ